MVQEGRRNATSNVRDVGEAVVLQISFVCRTRGDRALSSTRLLCTAGGSSDRTWGVNDLAGAAEQRRHPQRRFGVSRVDCAMARPAISPTTKADKACAERDLAGLCPGPWRGWSKVRVAFLFLARP